MHAKNRVVRAGVSVLLVLTLFSFLGCESSSNQSEVSSRQMDEITHALDEITNQKRELGEGVSRFTEGHQFPDKEAAEGWVVYGNVGMTVDIPEFGLENLVIRVVTAGNICEVDYRSSAYILADYRYGREPWHDAYLVVKTRDSSLLFDYVFRSLEDELYIYDITGDGIEDIIVQQQVGASGGAGTFRSSVFQIDGDKLVQLLDTPVYNPDRIQFDTGYYSVISEGFAIRIDNKYTGSSVSLSTDFCRRYTGFFFDDSGAVIFTTPAIFDSFYSFTPEDIDGDGVYEIVCEQYASLAGHSHGIGYAKTTLKFNASSGEFEVISTDFIPRPYP